MVAVRNDDDGTLGLRERKKRRTRQALIDAALTLVAERGYEQTTVADIAAAADVAPRTFFGYFAAKEDVLFAGTDERIELITAAFANLPADLEPFDALGQIVDRIVEMADVVGPGRLERMRAVLSQPALQAMALQRLFTAERLIGNQLRAAYADRYDDALARALAGAVVGGLVATVLHSAERGDTAEQTRAALHRTLAALRPTLRPADGETP